MIYLKISVISEHRIRITCLTKKEHVGKHELGFRDVVVGSYCKVSKCLVVVGLARELSVEINESKGVGSITEAEFFEQYRKKPYCFRVVAGKGRVSAVAGECLYLERLENMIFAELVREVHKSVDDLLRRVNKEQAVVPVVKECEHLFFGICALIFGKILILLVILYEIKQIGYLQDIGSGSSRELAVFDAVRDQGYPDHDGDDHVLIVLRKRRDGEIIYHVGVGSQKLIKAEITVEICRYRIPPVVSEILERDLLLIKVGKRSLKVR